ncbi:MAG: site-specific integrase [Actinomycetota bacterium]|nr:site-specific integrase [Actinomycetota bacterium]
MRGHVRKRWSTWSIVYDEGPDPVTGKRRQREKRGFRTRAEAEEALAIVIATLKTGGYVKPEDVTVREFLRDWLQRKAEDDLKPSTAASYQSKIESYLIPKLGAVHLQDLNVVMIEDALRELLRSGGGGRRPLSVRTVTYSRVLLRAALADAVRRGLLATNPATHARVPGKAHVDHTPRGVPQAPWSVEEVRAFLQSVHGNRLEALWVIYIHTGLRRGEALALRWSDFDLTSRRLRVERNLTVADRRFVIQTPKTKDALRDVALDEVVIAAMRAHRRRQAQERLAAGEAWQDRDLVFCRQDGSELDPDWISREFRRLTITARLRPVRLHDLRHGHATLMLRAGVPVEVVSRRLGHARISVTMDMYVHPDEEADHAAAQAWQRLLGFAET